MDTGFGIESSSAAGNGGGGSSRDMYFKQVSRSSHKISKPIRRPVPAATVSAPAAAAAPPVATVPIPEANPQPQSQQPPVYNINKNDFRDVVQKLTGSPSHERLPTPPPTVAQPRPSSSRLQRIRPPPLAQIGNRPPHLTQIVPRPPNDPGQRAAIQPLTPLPPLPSVHPAAESPISAYMRFLQSSSASSTPPLWNEVGPGSAEFLQLPPAESLATNYLRFLQNSSNSNASTWPQLPPSILPPHQQQPPLPSSFSWSSPFPVVPLSPAPFGCIPSPKSPYAMISPGLLFSPGGQLGLPQLPLSPTVPLPSPRRKGM